MKFWFSTCFSPTACRKKIQWRLMQVPFDPGSDVLLERFAGYAEECFTQHAAELTKPATVCSTCAELETYYQEVNLYYSFSKAMDMPIDEAWVSEARLQISKKIQRMLEKAMRFRTRRAAGK